MFFKMEIPKIDPFWDEQLASQHRHSTPTGQQPMSVGAGVPGSAHSPYERNLNFATVAVEDGEYGFPKKKTVRDPLSHRIIEKRRRDRMNNCLADLARLLPPSSLRKGRGRIEKTEIVELAIKHLRHLQLHPCPMGDKCEYGVVADPAGGAHSSSAAASCSSSSTSSGYQSSQEEQFRLGFQECLSEAMHFLVEQEGLYAGDAMCVRLVKHLNGHCDTVLRDHWGSQEKIVPGFRRESSADFKKAGCSGGSSSSGYHPNGSSSGSDGNGGNDGDGAEPFALPVQNPPQHSSSVLDYEAENSCSSTPLSIETSDVLSTDGKNNLRPGSKPPIPSIICSHSSSTTSRIPVNSGSPANGSTNGQSSDDGSANGSMSSAHRYKFKSNIKQRFTADCQVKPDDGCYVEGNPEKSSGADCNRDENMASDTEEGGDEGISLLEDGMMRQSSGEDCESKSIKRSSSPSRRDSIGVRGSQFCEGVAGANGKSLQQISAIDTPSPCSLLDKTTFSANSSSMGAKSSTSSSSTATPTPLSNQLDERRRDVEIKPSPEELLSAIHKLNGSVGGGLGSKSQSQLPLIIGGDTSPLDGENTGIPAFALHEKGAFYIPITIDKSAISPYVSKYDSSDSPPMYPVTISVCFVLNPDKKGSFDSITEPEVVAPLQTKPADFSRSAVSPVPLPMIAGGGGSGRPTKSSRRGHREGNNPFLVNRNGHGHARLSSKDSNSLARLSGTGNSTFGNNYQILPLHSSYLGSAAYNDMLHGSNTSSNSSFLTNPATGGTIYYGNYPDGNSGVAQGMAELSRGSGESESHSSSGCGRISNGGGGESSSGSSGITGNVSRARKRSISSSPSISGGSLGYHSWHEKTSPAPHDFFNFPPNTQNFQGRTIHGHLAPAAVPVGGRALSPKMEQRLGQALSAFHAETSLKEELCYAHAHEKRSKKARSVDQTLDTK